MLKIKLYPVGKKNQPKYRIVISEARNKRNGKYIESIGFYNPLTDPPFIKLDQRQYQYWLEKGAQPTQTVRNLANKK